MGISSGSSTVDPRLSWPDCIRDLRLQSPPIAAGMFSRYLIDYFSHHTQTSIQVPIKVVSSLEAVSQLTKMMKAKNYSFHEGVLDTFLHLRLLSESAYKASTRRVDKEDEQNGKPSKKTKQKKEFMGSLISAQFSSDNK